MRGPSCDDPLLCDPSDTTGDDPNQTEESHTIDSFDKRPETFRVSGAIGVVKKSLNFQLKTFSKRDVKIVSKLLGLHKKGTFFFPFFCRAAP